MKLSLDRKDLAEAVSFVARVSPKRTANPILAGVLLHAEGEELTLTVYDYETAAETSIIASVVTPGVALVHAATLAQVVAKLPQKPVTLEVSDTMLKITCGSVRASLPLMPAEEYPAPPLEGDALAKMSGALFEDAVQRVAPAASSDAAVPMLLGVHIVIGEKEVTFEATDRYRVAHYPVQCEVLRAPFEFVASASVLREAARAFGASSEVVFRVGENGTVTIADHRGVILARTITGNYPPVARLFPNEPRARAVVDREIAAEATGRAALAIESQGAIRFEFTGSECSVSGTSTADSKGVSEEFDIASDAEGVAVSLKPQFVLDGLASCRAETVELWFTHDSRDTKPGPVMFTAGDGFRYLMQPNLLLK